MSADTQNQQRIAQYPSRFTWGIVIPTIGTPEVLIPTLRRLCSSERLPDAEKEGAVCVMVAFNYTPDNLERKDEISAVIEELKVSMSEMGHEIKAVMKDHPIGFGHACNFGLEWMVREFGIPEMSIFFNDDLRTTPGWLQGIQSAFQTQTVRVQGEPPSAPTEGAEQFIPGPNGQMVAVGRRPDRPVSAYGRVGIVGPSSINVAGLQSVKLADKNARITEANADDFAKKFRASNAGEYLTASFLSGFCMAYSRECLVDVAFWAEAKVEGGGVQLLSVGVFDGDQYPVAGYEDNAACVMATDLGWRLLIDGATFIYHLGHQTFDKHFPEMDRGMRNRLNYYMAHAHQTQNPNNKKIIGVYRVRIETGNDIGLFRASLCGMSRLVDGFAILLTDNPLEASASKDWKPVVQNLSAWDREWLQACMDENGKGASPEQISQATERWVRLTLEELAVPRDGKVVPVKVDCWTGEFNERDERNRAIEIAEGMGADWIWSSDHDEIPEERVRRRHVDRWISHPDPMVSTLDQGWLNLWDSDRLVRVDQPWGDGNKFTGGMHGFRLYRVNQVAPERIMAGTENGLHCGNVPQVGAMAKRVAGMRVLHLGYQRHYDRVRKLARYREQDPNPSPWLVGGDSYGHLVQEEGLMMSPIVPVNGIGVHFLAYEGEDPDSVARMLDQLYTVADQIVMVWTGEWAEEDKLWLDDAPLWAEDDEREDRKNPGRLPDACAPGAFKEWPSTGPSRELAHYASLFKVRIVHHPLADNISAARNAGLDALQELAPKWGLGWAFFFDPDEHFQQPFPAMVCLRRMAEISEGWGWMVRFNNLQPNGAPTRSESVRMSRLDKDGIARMSGRVHEGFEAAWKVLADRGDSPAMRYAPFFMLNTGQQISDEKMEEKLARYTHLLRLELSDNPDNPKAWVSLGLQAENQGDLDAAVACYQRGMLCSAQSYLPPKELALYHLRMAKHLMEVCVDRTGSGHAFHRVAAEQLQILRELAPPRPLLGLARVDSASRQGLGFDLPAFPLLDAPERLDTPDPQSSVSPSEE